MSAVASVPLNIISVLFAVASIVIFPDEVDIVTAASPVDMSSAALEEVAQPNAPLPSVFITWSSEPSASGKVQVILEDTELGDFKAT